MKTVFLLARQRSGTNALQSVLAAHPEIHCTREIFHPDAADYAHLDPEQSWFRYVEREGAALEVLATMGGGERRFGEFLAYLRERAGKPHLVLDVKLNSLRNLDAPWQSPTGEPRLCTYIRARGFPVLVLRRRNHLRTYLSLLTAQRTRDWVVPAAHARDAPPIHLDIPGLLAALERSRAEDALIDAAFPDGPGRLTLEYAELFPRLGGPADAGQLARVAAWLGVPAAFPPAPVPEHRKLAVKPLEQAIDNYDEVADALRATEFAAQLEDEPAYR